MKISLRFLGAADTVTGSCHLLMTPWGNVLLDCGMFQGTDTVLSRNRRFEGVGPDDIDAVVLSHAHLDHCGRLPLLARMGYRGRVYATSATRDLARVVLLDSAGIQEEQARRAARRRNDGKPFEEVDLEPIYDTDDALEALDLLVPGIHYGDTVEPVRGIRVTFHDAGHILGSAFLAIEIERPGSTPFRLLFSGDLGNQGKPIVRDPSWPSHADALLIESTYGDRNHRSFAATVDEFRDIVTRTVANREVLLIPSFALERAQELLYVLHEFWQEGLLDNVPVYVDSPMAIDATRVFARHPDCYDTEAVRLAADGENPFQWGKLSYIREGRDSQRLNERSGPMIIISPSGMCTGGRIVHHLRNRLSDPGTTLCFMGFQGRGTLGRRLVDGAQRVRILGRELHVQARVETVNGFSAHADQAMLTTWLERTGPARDIWLVHGDEDKQEAFRAHLQTRFPDSNIHLPGHGKTVVLWEGDVQDDADDAPHVRRRA